ncbi:hypothetical protein ACIQW7_28240 [Peribacillus simplex]|uniref:hypothetical protein n=1 Tax=Peribacillus simplex TaxID=1478 RepID=UPI00380815B7
MSKSVFSNSSINDKSPNVPTRDYKPQDLGRYQIITAYMGKENVGLLLFSNGTVVSVMFRVIYIEGEWNEARVKY